MAYALSQQPPQLQLVTLFDLARNEFMIGFPTESQAEYYRIANMEARIFEHESKRDVWIPRPSGLKAIRGCSDGLALYFNDEAKAAAWCERIVIGRCSKWDRHEIYLRRKWDESELNEAIGRKRTYGVVAPVQYVQIQVQVPLPEIKVAPPLADCSADTDGRC